MLHLNLKLVSVCFCLALASCQSVQKPKPDLTEPAVIDTEVKIKTDDGLDVINMAIQSIKENDLGTAELILKTHLETHDDNRAKLNLALIYINSQQISKAKQLLLSIQQSDSSNSVVLEHLAIIARQEGQFKESKALYLQALEISDKPSIYLNYAILLDLYLNDLEPALEYYEIYQAAGLAKQDGIEIEKWIADLKVRMKRAQK